MTDQNSTEQLLELMIQLKKTTPDAARKILSSQPAIAYALISLMVSIGAINVDVFQKTLAQFHESNARGQAAAAPVPATIASALPISALPPHIQAQYRTATPPTHTPTPPQVGTYGYPTQQGYPLPAPSQGYPQPGAPNPVYAAYGGQPQQSQNQPQPGYPGYPPAGAPSGSYSAPPPNGTAGGRPQSAPAVRPEMLAAFPEDQKALIMHVVSMTQEQLNALPADQRGTYLQIRTTLGIH
ncbi:hypothetical protein AN958_10601 [Leucoagaricus sp. SymC.cos]|nr:hypothetical protein AN958_10601 [Leucoagaricus sp. SymC.cos]